MDTSDVLPPPKVHFTGCKEADFEARSRHTYPRTPNVGLAKALLDLVADPIVVGNTCLEACNQLADGLTATEPRAEEVVDVVVSMLGYARGVFQRGQLAGPGGAGSGAVEGVILCDHFVAVAELYGKLLRNNCAAALGSARAGEAAFSLRDLLAPEKARWLRDKLIDNDMLSIAVDVAAQCNISAGRIWSRWGFSMLHMGNYAGAREKFQYCFPSKNKTTSSTSNSGNTSSSSTTPPVLKRRGAVDDDPDPEELLAQIIDTLETEQDVDEAAIRAEFQEALSAAALPSAQSSALPPAPFQSDGDGGSNGDDGDDALSLASYLEAVDSSASATATTTTTTASDGTVVYEPFRAVELPPFIYAECMHYLKAYGTTKDTLRFLLRHGRLEEACRACLEARVAPAQFFETVVVHSISHAQLRELQEAMRRVDGTLAQWQEHLLFVCGFLSKHQAYDVLIDFQSFMRDSARAGKTALLMFLALPPTDFAGRLDALRVAKRMFTDALEHPAPVPQPGLASADVSLLLRGADLQLVVTQLFARNAKAVPPELLALSLFGTTQDRVRLAVQCVLLGNYDATFGIVQDFRLSGTQVYAAAMQALARASPRTRNGVARMFDLLKQARCNLLEAELDAVALAGMQVLVDELHDTKSAEKMLAKLASNKARVRGQALCGKFKAAYMAAAKDALVDEMQYVLSLAEGRDPVNAERCRQFLQMHGVTPSVPRQVTATTPTVVTPAPAASSVGAAASPAHPALMRTVTSVSFAKQLAPSQQQQTPPQQTQTKQQPRPPIVRRAASFMVTQASPRLPGSAPAPAPAPKNPFLDDSAPAPASRNTRPVSTNPFLDDDDDDSSASASNKPHSTNPFLDD